MFGATAAVTEHAATYLSISILGMPGMLIVFAATGLLRGLQNTKIPLLVSGLGFVANAGLNALLIYGIGLGVAGSAIGTVIAQWGMALIFIAVAVRAARAEGVSLRPGFAGVRLAAGSGGWLFLRTLTLRIALLTTVVVATDRGTEVLAATQIVFTIFSTLGFAHDALAIAGQAMVGKALGANDAAEARAINTRLLQWGILIGIAVAIPLVAASSVIGAIFTGDSAVQSLVMPGLILLALAQPIFAIVCVLDGVLIGSGDARYLAIVGVINLLVYLPLLWITEWAQLEGSEAMIAIWGAFAFGYLLARACTLWFRVRTDRWLVVGHSR
ncbi:MATE family efflux transporter [Humidisolicoccus flavus]|uniref:MATE family efflux transporter n=1 Tax=Humidisolicoccus flavus TaxID=3111414 RepID=UPI00324C451A